MADRQLHSRKTLTPKGKIERPSAIIYDAEIIKIIPGKGSTFKKIPHFDYCGGWEDFAGMGIACVCAYDLFEKRIRVFTKGNFQEMQDLFKEREEIIGYNSEKFDDKLMEAHGFKIRTTYDILHYARFAAGEPDKYQRGVSRGGFKLTEVAAANGFEGKMMNGADAPMMWQAGHYGKVIDYCIQDVMLTYKIFLKRHDLRIASYNKSFTLKSPKTMEVEYLEHKRQEREAAHAEEMRISNERAARDLASRGQEVVAW